LNLIYFCKNTCILLRKYVYLYEYEIIPLNKSFFTEINLNYICLLLKRLQNLYNTKP